MNEVHESFQQPNKLSSVKSKPQGAYSSHVHRPGDQATQVGVCLICFCTCCLRCEGPALRRCIELMLVTGMKALDILKWQNQYLN